ncbi:SHOCT domain-containing protein [Bifidobacterium sp. BRDM6]|uniref:SHOCT domain-containing protein n=2 Tax=Bifidobacterium choloepi TaxID=2614131 RepID=A0A6I5N0H2_9BIFI|nr:SHOCT domain-containing protein [Bifidobacterium choloepi]
MVQVGPCQLPEAQDLVHRIRTMAKQRGWRDPNKGVPQPLPQDTQESADNEADGFMDKLRELNAMKQNGLLTEEEFAAAKQKLLDYR